MRRLAISVFLMITFSLGLSAQLDNDGIMYLDFSIEKEIMLNDWFEDKLLSNYVDNIDRINASLRIEGKIYKNLGLWLSLGFSTLSKVKEVPSNFNFFDGIDLNKYNVENIHKTKQSESSSFLWMIGFSYKYKYKKWTYTPYVGYGSRSLSPNNLSCTITDSNSNYDVQYKWLDLKGGEYKDFRYLYLQFKTERNIYKKMNVMLGLSIRYYLTQPDFTASIMNHLDQSVIDKIGKKGNHITTIGISTGISF